VDWRLLGFPLIAGILVWNLWRAFARGEVWSRGGVVARAKSPILFWIFVAMHGTLLIALLVASAIHILFPPPLAERIAALYPRAAVAQKVEGHAVLSCTVTPSYGVKDCWVASESPPAVGFGPAAVEIAKLITLSGPDRTHVHPGQSISLPIRFKLPAGKA
jgi:TonB family protein